MLPAAPGAPVTDPIAPVPADGADDPSASDVGEEDGGAGLDDPAVREALQRESSTRRR